MAWPSDLKRVKCNGFNPLILPIIKDAIDQDLVEWGKYNLFLDEGIGEFKWMSCNWRLTEIRELVLSVELLEGKIDNPDLTALVLRG